jgi:nicotinate-nucleotide adenylyltransferase
VNTGVFGGAFDPPHFGHLALVRAALKRFEFERLLVVPAGDPPHKAVTTPAEIRCRLVELAFAGAPPEIEISRIELEPEGPYFTVGTLRLLAESHDDLTFLVGADQFADFRNWREPGAILELARLAVASRPGFEEEELRPVLAALARPDRVSFFPIPPLPLSSEQIRARVRQGLPIDELVPGAVVAEIEGLGLYRR